MLKNGRCQRAVLVLSARLSTSWRESRARAGLCEIFRTTGMPESLIGHISVLSGRYASVSLIVGKRNMALLGWQKRCNNRRFVFCEVVTTCQCKPSSRWGNWRPTSSLIPFMSFRPDDGTTESQATLNWAYTQPMPDQRGSQISGAGVPEMTRNA